MYTSPSKIGQVRTDRLQITSHKNVLYSEGEMLLICGSLTSVFSLEIFSFGKVYGRSHYNNVLKYTTCIYMYIHYNTCIYMYIIICSLLIIYCMNCMLKQMNWTYNESPNIILPAFQYRHMYILYIHIIQILQSAMFVQSESLSLPGYWLLSCAYLHQVKN